MAKLPKVTAVVERSEIIERRLANPHAAGSLEIPCKQKDRQNRSLLVFRIVSGDIGPDHIYRTVKIKGWEFAVPEDIDGNPEDYGFTLTNGRLVRGARGQDVLMKMRRVDFDAIQAEKTKRNSAAVSGRATKQAIVDNASHELGDEGADFLNRNISNLSIRDTMERVPVDEQ